MIFVRTAVFALACVIWAGGAFAQGKWTKLAAFPEPAEELLGASAGGKMYVFCGLAPGWKPIVFVHHADRLPSRSETAEHVHLPAGRGAEQLFRRLREGRELRPLPLSESPARPNHTGERKDRGAYENHDLLLA